MESMFVDVDGKYYSEQSVNASKIPLTIVAKKLPSNCYILASDEGDLFHPIKDIFSINKKDRQKGGNFFKFNKCNNSCFSEYLVFLQNKNNANFNLAQRMFYEKN
jgi:hypothetical protein